MKNLGNKLMIMLGIMIIGEGLVLASLFGWFEKPIKAEDQLTNFEIVDEYVNEYLDGETFTVLDETDESITFIIDGETRTFYTIDKVKYANRYQE